MCWREHISHSCVRQSVHECMCSPFVVGVRMSLGCDLCATYVGRSGGCGTRRGFGWDGVSAHRTQVLGVRGLGQHDGAGAAQGWPWAPEDPRAGGRVNGVYGRRSPLPRSTGPSKLAGGGRRLGSKTTAATATRGSATDAGGTAGEPTPEVGGATPRPLALRARSPTPASWGRGLVDPSGA